MGLLVFAARHKTKLGSNQNLAGQRFQYTDASQPAASLQAASHPKLSAYLKSRSTVCKMGSETPICP